MVALRGTWQSSVIQASTDVQEWHQLTVGSSMYRVIWWQVVPHRWYTHLEQPTWFHPRLVSVILNIRKTVDYAPRLGVYYFLSLTLSVCLSVCMHVCLSQRLLLLFCFSMESSHFLAISSQWQKLQNFVLRFLPCDAMRCTVFMIVILSVCQSVCPSVRLSLCHTRGLCPYGSTYDHDFFTVRYSPINLVSADITFIPKFEGSPRARALNEGGVGTNWRFSTNKKAADKGYYWSLIGNRIRAFDRYQNQRPWLTLKWPWTAVMHSVA